MEQIIYETTAPHLKSRMTTDKIMKYIIMALLPAGIHGVYRYGLHAGVLILITCAASVMTQIVYEKIAGKHSSVKDCRVLLNGLIMSYCLPPSVNWTVAALAGVVCGLLMSVSVHLFERNLVSPIILTRLILTWIFPEEMSVFVLDGVTMATPLALLKEQQDVNTLFMIFGKTGGCIGETSALLLCLGAIFLIAREIIDFRVSGMYLFSFAAFTGPSLISEAVTWYPSAASPMDWVPIPQAQSRTDAQLSKPLLRKILSRITACSWAAAFQSIKSLSY